MLRLKNYFFIQNSKEKKRKKAKKVFLGIGTNKGDREKNISLALKLLQEDKHIKVLKTSKMLKNPPQEGIKSGYFLNGAIEILTTLRPFELLRVLKRIESKLGRKINTKSSALIPRPLKKKSRTIDLDILFFENEVISTKNLTIPHSKLHFRSFVLIPLLEIARNYKHPVLKKTVQELSQDLYVSY